MAQPLQHQPPRPFAFRWGFTSRFTGRAGLATFALFLGLAAAGVAIVAFAATQQWPAALGGSAGSSQVIRLTGQTPPAVKKILGPPAAASANGHRAHLRGNASPVNARAPRSGSGAGGGAQATAPVAGGAPPSSSHGTSNTGSGTTPATQPAPTPQATPGNGSGGGSGGKGSSGSA